MLRISVAIACMASLAAAQGEELTPPRVIESTDPVYPTSEEASGLTPSVTLHVTLGSDGHLVNAEIDHGAGEPWDQAAIEAVQHWRFEPARRGDQPIASRIRVELRFHLPHFDIAPEQQQEPEPPVPAPVPAPVPD